MQTKAQLSYAANAAVARFSDYLTGNSDAIWAYRCCNGVQDFDRLSFHCLGAEVQINAIRHARGWHYHKTDMTSVILVGGYHWSLRQAHAITHCEQFAAAGSIIHMGPDDSHSISEIDPQADEPLSLCVFESQTDWHLHFEPLSPLRIAYLMGRAIQPLRQISLEKFSWAS